MPPNKSAKRGKKAKKVKYVPDPDLAFKDQLNAEYYIPKIFRDNRNIELSHLVDEAILSALVGFHGEWSEEATEVPMSLVGFICGALGFCLTPEQLGQVKTMVSPSPKAALEPSTVEGENGSSIVEKKLQIEVADRARLHRFLVELFYSRIISYDAQVLENPDPSLPTRVLSVAYSTQDQNINRVFEALWPACGSQYTLTKKNEKIRCLNITELSELVRSNSTANFPFTNDELRDFVLSFEESGEDIIREDNFLLIMKNVN